LPASSAGGPHPSATGPGTTAGTHPGSTVSTPGAGPKPSAKPGAGGPVAYATPSHPGAEPGQAPEGSGSDLNARLNAMLPSGPVAYSHKHYGGDDVGVATQRAQEAAYAAVRPPPNVLERALYVIRRGGGLMGRGTVIMYVVSKKRIFGLELCTGWRIEMPAGGGAPIASYTTDTCAGELYEPSGALPTLPPKKVLPQAGASPSPGPSG
jgi:hypothetical protein